MPKHLIDACSYSLFPVPNYKLLAHDVEGGTFALYSLICRHARVSLLPNRQAADEAVSTYKLEHHPETGNSSKMKSLLEKHKALHTALLILVLLGTCMVIGDGVLTPAISGMFFHFPIEDSRVHERTQVLIGSFNLSGL